jgi:hypothetical protein
MHVIVPFSSLIVFGQKLMSLKPRRKRLVGKLPVALNPHIIRDVL